jgi:hypothetical protein
MSGSRTPSSLAMAGGPTIVPVPFFLGLRGYYTDRRSCGESQTLTQAQLGLHAPRTAPREPTNVRCWQKADIETLAIGTSFQVWIAASTNQPHGVEISPLLVATMKRLPQRTIESTLPTLGTVCPGITLQMPFGPSNSAVPLATSRSFQPGMVCRAPVGEPGLEVSKQLQQLADEVIE